MSKYIDADRVMREVNETYKVYESTDTLDDLFTTAVKRAVHRILSDAPAEDVVPVKEENIFDKIDGDLSLEELGELLKKVLAEIYSKLKNEIGIQRPVGVIKSLGEREYDVDVVFISGDSCGPGESYESMYYV